MNVVVAIDSFKGSMTSMQAGKSTAAGIKRVFPDAEVTVHPLADGGEGTVEALTTGCDGTLTAVTVTGPLGRPVLCQYGILEKTKTALIEMSGAAGITLISEQERNPLATTTYGVGEVIRDAVKRGCRHFIVGIGGSATNDGGIGMLQALGFGFFDKNGVPIRFGASGLADLCTITDDNVLPELSECTFRIACDVNNPLCGENGCSAVFGPQKGATPSMITEMDRFLSDYAVLARKKYEKADPCHAGAGAAGGLGFAFLTFLNATLESGIQIVLDETHLSDYIRQADIVVTGEGRLDGQTVMGKAPIGVAKIAKSFGKPVIAFSGCVTKEASSCNQAGIDAFFPILRSVVSKEDAKNPQNAGQNLSDTTEQVFRVIRTFSEI